MILNLNKSLQYAASINVQGTTEDVLFVQKYYRRYELLQQQNNYTLTKQMNHGR